MLEMQQNFNDSVSGTGWENGTTKHGKTIDWKRCIYLECSELIESYPWKHWKNISDEPDYNNIKIEAVDIWHFVMSLMLEDYKVNSKGNINKITHDIQSLSTYQIFKYGNGPKQKDYYSQIKVSEKLMHEIFCGGSTKDIVEAFFDISIQSDLDLNSLYQLYIGKNILNEFRQTNGYKDGNYRKMWNGVEDNVIMQRELDSNPDITPDELRAFLTEVY